MRRLFVGHTRFSVHQYSSGSFRATRRGDGAVFSEEEYTAWLYSDERLAPRTAIFVEESLPQLADSLANAEDVDAVHVVHHSPSLPEKYRTILADAAAEHPFLHLNEAPGLVAPSAPNKKVLNRVLRGRIPEDGLFGIYRLDDDDVLPIDFFGRMASYIDEDHVSWRISFPESLTAIRTASTYIRPWSRYFPKAAAGLLSVHQKTDDGTIHGLQEKPPAKGHMKLDTEYPTVLDSRAPGFFQARHASQDSTLGDGPSPFYSKIIAASGSMPDAPDDLLESYFPHVSHRIRRNLTDYSHDVPLPSVPAPLGDGVTQRLPDDTRAQLIFAEVDQASLGSRPVELRIQVKVVSEDHPADLDSFMVTTGFERIDKGRYSGTMRAGYRPGLFELVVEVPPNARLGELRLNSTSGHVGLTSLRSYPLV